jgi:hypothetical protein
MSGTEVPAWQRGSFEDMTGWTARLCLWRLWAVARRVN